MSEETFYLASRDSSGIHEVKAIVEGKWIIGQSDKFGFYPAARLCDIEGGSDWRVSNWFRKKEDALADYIKVEKERIRVAKRALAAAQLSAQRNISK